MPTPCTICPRADRPAIDIGLHAGTSFRAIAATAGRTTKDAVGRRARNCLGLTKATERQYLPAAGSQLGAVGTQR